MLEKPQKEIIPNTSFYTIEGLEDRFMILQDFDKFLRSQEEYRKGAYATTPLFDETKQDWLPGFQLRFFNSELNTDDIFKIISDYDKHKIEITTVSGDKNRVIPYLEKFGFSSSQ